MSAVKIERICNAIRDRDIKKVKVLAKDPAISFNAPWLNRVIAYAETGNAEEIEILDPVYRPLAWVMAKTLRGEQPNAD